MKISQKYIQYILLLLIVVIGVCAYQFGYVKYIEKANAVKEENKTIEDRINVLTEKETHRTEWDEAITQSDKDIKELLAKYGPGNTPEKSIMFITSLEEAAEMTIPTIAFSNDTPLFVSSDYDEAGNPKITLSQSNLSINYSTTYDGLKKCMDYINSYYERMNVASFSANFNQETGQLSGSMIINLFGVKDENHVYQDPVVSGIKLGTDNIFGTIDLTAGEDDNVETGNEETGIEPENEAGTPAEGN